MRNSISTIKIFIFFVLFLAGIAEHAIATPPQIPPEFRDKTSDWEIYRNEEYGYKYGGNILHYEFRYPEGWVFESGRRGEIFQDSRTSVKCRFALGGSVASRSTFGYSQIERREITADGKKTILSLLKNNESSEESAKFIVGVAIDKGLEFYGSIFSDKPDECFETFDIILSTFKFIPSENQPQTSNIELKESVEYTTPGGISPPLFKGLQWLATLLIIGAFIFKFKPHIFKVIFSIIFAAMSLILLNSCFITDASLPKFCEYRALSLPVFIFADPLGDNIPTVALRTMIMPILVPLWSFFVWYAVGSILFAIYRRVLKVLKR